VALELGEREEAISETWETRRRVLLLLLLHAATYAELGRVHTRPKMMCGRKRGGRGARSPRSVLYGLFRTVPCVLG
jgi:hypothetical protein